MKKTLLFIFPLSITLIFSSCFGGHREDPEKQTNKTTNPLQALVNMEKNIVSGNNASQEKLKARRAKGDTLAMPYAELMKYLPESVDGYTREEPKGENINMPGMSYSSADVRFKNSAGDHIKVTLVDYNASFGLYQGVTAMWASGFSMDSPEKKAGGIKLGADVVGWEDYNKKSKRAEVTLGVGSRFYIMIEAQNQESTEFAKTIAKSFDLDKLSSL